MRPQPPEPDDPTEQIGRWREHRHREDLADTRPWPVLGPEFREDQWLADRPSERRTVRPSRGRWIAVGAAAALIFAGAVLGPSVVSGLRAAQPSPTSPSTQPAVSPSASASDQPSDSPSDQPSDSATDQPTDGATDQPTDGATDQPGPPAGGPGAGGPGGPGGKKKPGPNG